MKRILFSIASALAVAVSSVGVTFAQDDGPPNFVPVEMQVCNYNDGKDSGDLDAALDDMVEWMEAYHQCRSNPYGTISPDVPAGASRIWFDLLAQGKNVAFDEFFGFIWFGRIRQTLADERSVVDNFSGLRGQRDQ